MVAAQISHSGLDALLTPEESVLILIDHQAFQFANMHSHEPQLVVVKRRMVQAGIKPITWLAVLCEWQRDWARQEAIPALAGILMEHGGGSGVAFGWEAQLLKATANSE